MPQENLSRFFVVNNLKGERKLIEIFAHRICFCSIAIWIREDFNFSVTFQMLPGVCKSPRALWHKYSENCLVVVRSPLHGNRGGPGEEAEMICFQKLLLWEKVKRGTSRY